MILTDEYGQCRGVYFSDRLWLHIFWIPDGQMCVHINVSYFQSWQYYALTINVSITSLKLTRNRTLSIFSWEESLKRGSALSTEQLLLVCGATPCPCHKPQKWGLPRSFLAGKQATNHDSGARVKLETFSRFWLLRVSTLGREQNYFLKRQNKVCCNPSQKYKKKQDLLSWKQITTNNYTIWILFECIFVGQKRKENNWKEEKEMGEGSRANR